MKPLTFRRASKFAWQARWKTVAAVMLPIYFLTSLPPGAFAANAGPSDPGPVLTPKNVHANKTKPRIKPYAGVQLATQPTDHDITYCHAFQQPLVPVGGKTTPAENQALAAAIKTHLQRRDDEDVSALENFLASHANSAWRASLDLNLAEVYYRTGNFTPALSAWQDAWDRTQSLTDDTGQQVANLAVAKLAKMKGRIGRMDELDSLLTQVKGRSLTGPAAEMLVSARTSLWMMKNRPEDSFRCGPAALQELSLATRHKVEHPEIIKKSRSTVRGISLTDVQALSGQIGMPMQMARHAAGTPFVTPAVVHWKLGHYAALVGQQDGKYVVHDTTFGGRKFLVSAQVLEKEASGYFLVPTGHLPAGWSSVSPDEGRQVFGKGLTFNLNDMCYAANDVNSGGDCGSGGSGLASSNPDAIGADGNNNGDDPTNPVYTAPTSNSNDVDMTVPAVKAMLVSLNLLDTPVRYAPPVGPAMHFTVNYNQREIVEPTIRTTSNLGPNWTFSYHSYVVPGPLNASVYERGGGFTNNFYDLTTKSYYPEQRTQAVLKQINSTTWQRTLAGGEVEIYGQPDGGGNFYLTQITDPQGNSLTLSYDSQMRIVSLADALGQVTTISYGDPSYPYQITQVADPFGRHADFSYNGHGQLTQISDIMGITSQFTYKSPTDNFIKTLVTPYGTTSFAYGDISTDFTLGTTRWLETTYPDLSKTRTEYRDSAPGMADTDPQGVPAGMYPGTSAINQYMSYRNTYYWDQQAMKDHPGDYTKAQIIHWLHTSDINTTSGMEESLKKVGQNRIWYAHNDEISSIQASDSTIPAPTQKGRIVDDGSPQLFQYKYNLLGKITQVIDPAGRETDYDYATNSIDLLNVRQKNGSAFDFLSIATYNNQHEPLTVTDGSGQTTTYTYYANGELHTVTNPKGQATTYVYNPSGYLTSVTGAVPGSTTTFTYDGYGRVRTVTDSQGYATTTDYDAMDRPTQITYPDSTTSQFIYQNLDLQYSRDRLKRVMRYFYDSLRRPVAVQDALGHTAQSSWTLVGLPSSITDPSGHVTNWQYDGQNRPIEKDYPDGRSEHSIYENTTNRLKTVTDAKGQVATTTYNADNTVAQVVYTNATVATPTVSFTYDPVYPRVHTMTDGTGTTTTTYNVTAGTLGFGQPLGVVTPLATISYTSSTGAPLYDELGRALGQSVDGVASSVTYDTLGRVVTTTNALSATAFQYTYLNNTGRIASVTKPNGQSTVYTYQDSSTTAEPRLSEIKNLNASSAVISKFDYLYDAQGQITSWTQQADASHPSNWALKYDAAGRLLFANVTDTVTSAVQHQYGYSYDKTGNRLTEQVDGNVTGASYNNLNQLIGQSAGGQMTFSGALSRPSTVTVGGNPAAVDANNNFTGTANVVQGTNTVNVVANDMNGEVMTNKYQVVIPPASGSYTYDFNGNLVTDGSRTYQWDAKDEMTAIIYNSGPNVGNHTEFTYNGLGARVKIVERTGTTVGSGTITSTKQFVANEERDGSNVTTRRYFAQGEQRIVSGTTTNYFYTRDHLGSIREMVDSSGTIQARYSYDPFGRRTKISGSLDCDFGFTSYYYHSTSGLYLSPTRAYDPNVGRFISRDPSGEGSGMNLYAYCANNPINNIDPTGLFSVSDVTTIITAIVESQFVIGGTDSLSNSSGGCMEDSTGGPGAQIGLVQKGLTCVPTSTAYVINRDVRSNVTPEQIENEMVPGNNWSITGVATAYANTAILNSLHMHGVTANEITQDEIGSSLSKGPVVIAVPLTQPGTYHEIVLLSQNPDGSYEAYDPATGKETPYPASYIHHSPTKPIATVEMP